MEQILGRILRQPYVTKHKELLLNMSYVLTASAKFMDTLQNIVKGLNKAGFSSQDYKLADNVVVEEAPKTVNPLEQLTMFPTKEDPKKDDSKVPQEDTIGNQRRPFRCRTKNKIGSFLGK